MKFVKLKEVCEFVGGSQPPAQYFSDEPKPGYIRLLQIRDFESDDKAVYIPEHLAKRICSEEDVMIARYGGFNNYKTLFKILKGKSGSYNVALIKTVPNEDKILKKFLYFALQLPHLKEEIIRKSSRAVQSGFTMEDLNNLEIPLPSLGEQKHLVVIFEETDTLRKERQEANELNSSVIQSIFLEMFGEPELNPKKFDIRKLEDVCILKGQYGSGGAAIKYNPQKPRYIRITDINEDGFLNEEVVSPGTDKEEWNDCILKEGDVLFARSGATVGKTYRYREEDGFCIFAGYLIRFRPNRNLVHPDYLYFLTKTNSYWKWVESKKKTVAQPNINAKQYGKELLIPLPPFSEQQKFADLVQKVEKIKEKQQESKQELDNLFNSLMQKVFKG